MGWFWQPKQLKMANYCGVHSTSLVQIFKHQKRESWCLALESVGVADSPSSNADAAASGFVGIVARHIGHKSIVPEGECCQHRSTLHVSAVIRLVSPISHNIGWTLPQRPYHHAIYWEILNINLLQASSSTRWYTSHNLKVRDHVNELDPFSLYMSPWNTTEPCQFPSLQIMRHKELNLAGGHARFLPKKTWSASHPHFNCAWLRGSGLGLWLCMRVMHRERQRLSLPPASVAAVGPEPELQQVKCQRCQHQSPPHPLCTYFSFLNKILFGMWL